MCKAGSNEYQYPQHDLFKEKDGNVYLDTVFTLGIQTS